MKRLVTLGITLILVGVLFLYKDDIVNSLHYISIKLGDDVTLTKNEYYRDYDFMFVQNTDNFSPKNIKDIYNIYYSVINSGSDNFSFYCPSEYKTCLDDVKDLAYNQELLSHINNFVHPFNSFKNIETKYNAYGKVSINITHAYTKEQIKLINDKVNQLESELMTNRNLSMVEKIKIYHDYIINNSKYDIDRSEHNIVNYSSDLAYGPLFEGYAICGGYTDLMALFLEKLNIKNYKVSSSNHVWNVVYLNGNWLNLDLTWDDPITDSGVDLIEYNFFLIYPSQLLKLEKNQHNYDANIYQELKI